MFSKTNGKQFKMLTWNVKHKHHGVIFLQHKQKVRKSTSLIASFSNKHKIILIMSQFFQKYIFCTERIPDVDPEIKRKTFYLKILWSLVNYYIKGISYLKKIISSVVCYYFSILLCFSTDLYFTHLVHFLLFLDSQFVYIPRLPTS